MAIRAISMDQTVDYVSDLDPAKGTEKEQDEATIFVLGTLSARQLTIIKDSATSFRPDKDSPDFDPKNPQMVAEFRPNESTYLMTQFGLRGWKRFVDLVGNEVEFRTVQRQVGGKSYQVVHPDCMDQLGQELIRELAEAIEKLNTPTEVELKD